MQCVLLKAECSPQGRMMQKCIEINTPFDAYSHLLYYNLVLDHIDKEIED